MHTKKIIFIILFSIISICLYGCREKNKNTTTFFQTSNETQKLIYPIGYEILKENVEPNLYPLEGLSLQFDSHYFNYEKAMRENDEYFDNIDENIYWNIVEERLKKLNVKRFRVMLKPGWYEPNNDNDDCFNIDYENFNFDSFEMNSVYKVLDLAEKLSIKVTLVLWGVEVNYNNAANNYKSEKYWMVGNNSSLNWCVGAKGDMMYEYVENFSAVVQYLLNIKKYTCIDQVTPGNEPDWQWQIDGTRGDAEEYVKMCVELDRRFRSDGIRDKVLFNLVDGTDSLCINWLNDIAEDLIGIADVINTHTYFFSSDTKNSVMEKWINTIHDYSMLMGTKFWIGEFGSNKDGNENIAMIDDYYRTVGLARQYISFIKYGAVGASYWVSQDSAFYYADSDIYDSYCIDGLWSTYKHIYDNAGKGEYVKEDFYRRKQYYMFELLSSNMDENSKVYQINLDEEYIVGILLLNDDNQTLIIVNNSNEEKKYTFKVNDYLKEYKIITYSEDCFVDGEYIENSNISYPTNQCVSFDMPKQSIVVVKGVN